jgi:hypothetical protein
MNKSVFLFFLCLFLFGVEALADNQTFYYERKDRRDPFWSLVSPSGTILTYDQDLAFSDLVLEGITFDQQGKSIAIINSSIVGSNDQIGGYQIIEIRRLEVVLLKNGKTYILKMKRER